MNLIKIMLPVILFFALPVVSAACDITWTIEGAQKEKYQPGDIVVIKIIVELTHRHCNVDIDETKITVSGLEIKGATKWVNLTGRVWERKMKVAVTSNQQGKAIITAKRTCDKDGGFGTLTLSTVPGL